MAFRFREKVLPAGCRQLQASILRYPECANTREIIRRRCAAVQRVRIRDLISR